MKAYIYKGNNNNNLNNNRKKMSVSKNILHVFFFIMILMMYISISYSSYASDVDMSLNYPENWCDKKYGSKTRTTGEKKGKIKMSVCWYVDMSISVN